MRPLVPLWAAIVLATLVLPTAAARAQATLTLEAPAEAAPGEVPYRLTLELSDFVCRHDRWVIVHISAEGEAPDLALGADKIAFLVSEGSYLSESYRGVADSWIRASGPGAATVTATLGDDLDDCFTAGDLKPASASWDVTFTNTPSSPPPSPPSPSPTSPPSPSSSPTPPPRASTLPPGAGFIGDYKAPAESSGANDTPGLGLAAVLAACAACAILIRRSR